MPGPSVEPRAVAFVDHSSTSSPSPPPRAAAAGPPAPQARQQARPQQRPPIDENAPSWLPPSPRRSSISAATIAGWASVGSTTSALRGIRGRDPPRPAAVAGRGFSGSYRDGRGVARGSGPRAGPADDLADAASLASGGDGVDGVDVRQGAGLDDVGRGGAAAEVESSLSTSSSRVTSPWASLPRVTLRMAKSWRGPSRRSPARRP